MIKLGIDASNIVSGGGVTHLVELLRAIDIHQHERIESIEVWAPQKTLDKIEKKKGLHLKGDRLLEGNFIQKAFWQYSKLSNYAQENYDVLYVPGGSYFGNFKPIITMNRNLLPFDREERSRYGASLQMLRMIALSKVQVRTYRHANGVIFLSEAARQITEQHIGEELTDAKIIPHGIATKFYHEPRPQNSIRDFNFDKPFRFLYVSTITVYKHQWNVIETICNLREQGYPVALDLVGKITTKKGKKLFDDARSKYDPNNEFVNYHGATGQNELLNYYHHADGFVFASSCETFGQILLEAMASGLPITCSDRSAMPEILLDNGLYFDPEDTASIKRSLQKLIESKSLREKLATGAFERAHQFSWHKCATETFDYICQLSKASKA